MRLHKGRYFDTQIKIVDKIQEVKDWGMTAVADRKEEKTMAESMKDFEKELEESYKVMGDGEKDTDTLLAWEKIKELYAEQATLDVTVSGIVNKGVIALVEGIRGFIPASRLSLSHVDDLNPWLGRELKVRIITADAENDKLVLSAREILKEQRDAEKKLKVAEIKEGEVLIGKVETIKDYGAFVDLGDGVSGLVHISQISLDRIKHPSVVLKEGQEVQVKVIGNKDGKISLSMKALLQEKEQEVIADINRLAKPDTIHLESDLALIAVVGRGMKSTRGTAGRLFSALAHAHINVKMIDQGSSELNIIIGVREHDFEAAIKAIYDIFVNTQL